MNRKKGLSARMIAICCGLVGLAVFAVSQAWAASEVVSLDGADWQLAIDPANLGRRQQWWNAARAGAVTTRVPWIIQDRFPGYHGAAWYWQSFQAPGRANAEGRALLRFWSVSYAAEVWLNGVFLGGNEGAEVPFILDATDALRPGRTNLLTVRVVDPAETGTDGLIRSQIPGGLEFNMGGIEDSVELCLRPPVYFSDVYARPDPATGLISIEATIHNALTNQAAVEVNFAVTPSPTNRAVARSIEPGDTVLRTELAIAQAHLWDLNDPFLYRINTRVAVKGSTAVDEQVTRVGFRDFRLENGYFRLNGRRIFLHMAHTGQDPFGLRVPFKADWPLADLRLMKAMGFNSVRLFQSLGYRHQLDFADEFGFLLYEEPRGGWMMDHVPGLYEQRRDRIIRAMLLRDRNHPSIVAWGLLNETPAELTTNNPVFLHAQGALGLIRSNDNTRLVFLNSGRWDGEAAVGSIANPGSREWQHLLGCETNGAAPITPWCRPYGARPPPPALPIAGYVGPMGDVHIYPRIPHTAMLLDFLRTVGAETKNIFVSEYGISSAVDLERLRNFLSEQGYAHLAIATNVQGRLERFMADWERWRMGESFGSPSNYLRKCYLSNARQRLIGFNALRANPRVTGCSMTAALDTAGTGEGVIDPFREVKPGMADAISDAFAPLRWCLFAEPPHVYCGAEIKLEAVLANEDVLASGSYPVNISVVGPTGAVVFTEQTAHQVPHGVETPFAVGVFGRRLKVDWPAGVYRLRATFTGGPGAAGQEVTFHVSDANEMPAVKEPVWLWGAEAELSDWLSSRGIQCRALSPESVEPARLILASRQAPAPGGQTAFASLVKRIEEGAQVVFLDPAIFADGKDATAFVPLKNRGKPADPRETSSLYGKDEWAKQHPIFAGTPAGDVLDINYYRELLSDELWQGQDAPQETVAGAIATSLTYFSGLRVGVYGRGRGRWIFNSFQIRENLGRNPAAERLLRNMLRYLGGE